MLVVVLGEGGCVLGARDDDVLPVQRRDVVEEGLCFAHGEGLGELRSEIKCDK